MLWKKWYCEDMMMFVYREQVGRPLISIPHYAMCEPKFTLKKVGCNNLLIQPYHAILVGQKEIWRGRHVAMHKDTNVMLGKTNSGHVLRVYEYKQWSIVVFY